MLLLVLTTHGMAKCLPILIPARQLLNKDFYHTNPGKLLFPELLSPYLKLLLEPN
jgi:hypothetical protein